MLHGREVEVCLSAVGAFDGMFVPPIEFNHVGDAQIGQPGLQAQRYQKERSAIPRWISGFGALVQVKDGPAIQMVVVIVRDHHDIDGRQIFQGHSGRLLALGAQQLHRRRALAEDWVGQHIKPAGLHQGAGVADPGHQGLHCFARFGIGVDQGQVRCLRGRGSFRRAGKIVPKGVPFPAQQIEKRFLYSPDVVVFKAVGGVVGARGGSFAGLPAWALRAQGFIRTRTQPVAGAGHQKTAGKTAGDKRPHRKFTNSPSPHQRTRRTLRMASQPRTKLVTTMLWIRAAALAASGKSPAATARLNFLKPAK